MAHPTRLMPAETSLVVVDVQEKLLPKIPYADRLVANIRFLLEVAELLDVQRLATEQYPKGLGATVPALAEKTPSPRADKVGFSCCAIDSFVPELYRTQKKRIVLTGIETHVCILNTALDLLAESFWVYLPVDAVGSRFAIDHETALRRLEGAGCILTTTETIAFEWLGGANHPKFKETSQLIQTRMAQSNLLP
ncbi:MAG: hydrolase [Planctomycetota bacterium]